MPPPTPTRNELRSAPRSSNCSIIYSTVAKVLTFSEVWIGMSSYRSKRPKKGFRLLSITTKTRRPCGIKASKPLKSDDI